MKLLVFAVALLMIAAVSAYGHRALDLPAQDTEVHHIVQVPHDASFKSVAGQLSDKGLIVSPFWFRLLGKMHDAERKIKPGEYDFNTRMRPTEILDALVKGRVILYSVLIPEGLTAYQTCRLISEAHLADEAALGGLISNPGFLTSLGVEAPTMEGYLYPDTYFFPKGTRPEEILKTMVGRFRHLYTEELQTRAGELKLTERQVLILASIIEKETGQEDERFLISAVFHNRLRKNWPLQSDPTVIYDIPDFDGNLTRKHLARQTPFNTYVHPGLPPGPIANPGLKSIIAALNPAPVKYLFFVSKNDGTHQFSVTLEEHNKAVAHYQKRGSRNHSPRKVS